MRSSSDTPTLPTFESLLEESQALLFALKTTVTSSKDILNPTKEKKQILYVRINKIMGQLQTTWHYLHEQEQARHAPDAIAADIAIEPSTFRIPVAKQELTQLMKQLSDIIQDLITLDHEQENAFKQKFMDFNANVQKFNKEHNEIRAYTAQLATLEYSKNASIYMDYVTSVAKAIAIVVFAVSHTLGAAAKKAGAIFYPISASFTTLAKLFASLKRITQLRAAVSKEEDNEILKLQLEEAKSLLADSALFRILIFLLNGASILAFAGLLTTPIGWPLVAGATLIEWVDDELGAWKRASHALEKFKKEHGIINIPDSTTDEKIIEEFTLLQKTVDTTKSQAIWGFINVIAMVLIACGPIPIAGPFLGLAGLGLFGIVSVRNGYVAAKPYVEKYFPDKKQGTNEEPVSPEKDLRFSNKKTLVKSLGVTPSSPLSARHHESASSTSTTSTTAIKSLWATANGSKRATGQTNGARSHARKSGGRASS